MLDALEPRVIHSFCCEHILTSVKSPSVDDSICVFLPVPFKGGRPIGGASKRERERLKEQHGYPPLHKYSMDTHPCTARMGPRTNNVPNEFGNGMNCANPLRGINGYRTG